MRDTPALTRQARKLAQQGLNDYQVAKQFFDPNDPIGSCYGMARALHSPSGLDLSEFQVAKVLHHEEGLGLPVDTVAKVLSSPSGLHLSVLRVAKALHHEKGLGLSLETVAQVLHHKSGANLSPATVAIALSHTAGLSVPPHKLVPSLAAITSSDDALFEATVPLVRSGYERPDERLALMETLLHHLPTERSLPLLAKAILAGKRPFYSPETLARLLAAEDGLELPPQSVVYALTHHDGPRMTPAQVARILTDDRGLGLRPTAAVEALACGAALAHHEAHRIVGDGMDSDHFPVLERDGDKPALASAVSMNRLVR